jgi:hypothetical protein
MRTTLLPGFAGFARTVTFWPSLNKGIDVAITGGAVAAGAGKLVVGDGCVGTEAVGILGV